MPPIHGHGIEPRERRNFPSLEEAESCPASASLSLAAKPPPMSASPRDRTAASHRRPESLPGLPGAVRTRNDCREWLGRFPGLHGPMEQSAETCVLLSSPQCLGPFAGASDLTLVDKPPMTPIPTTPPPLTPIPSGMRPICIDRSRQATARHRA
jgi:hypothetical protein